MIQIISDQVSYVATSDDDGYIGICMSTWLYGYMVVYDIVYCQWIHVLAWSSMHAGNVLMPFPFTMHTCYVEFARVC